MKIAYKRVSTIDQHPENQLADMTFDRTYQDYISGKTYERPQLDLMKATLRPGDEVHVNDMTRLGRSLTDLHRLVEEITGLGATIIFHKESMTFSPEGSNPHQKLMFNFLAAFAEFERELMLIRQREGIARAKAEGKYQGRRSQFTDEQLANIREEFSTSTNRRQMAKRLGISRSRLYQIAQEATQ